MPLRSGYQVPTNPPLPMFDSHPFFDRIHLEPLCTPDGNPATLNSPVKYDECVIGQEAQVNGVTCHIHISSGQFLI